MEGHTNPPQTVKRHLKRLASRLGFIWAEYGRVRVQHSLEGAFYMTFFGQVEAEALPEVQPTVPMPGVFLESIQNELQNDKCILFGVKFKDHTKYSELYSTLSTGGPARRDFCRSRTAGTRQKQRRRGVRNSCGQSLCNFLEGSFYRTIFWQVEVEARPEVPKTPVAGDFRNVVCIQNDKSVLFGVKFKDHTKYSKLKLYRFCSGPSPARR